MIDDITNEILNEIEADLLEMLREVADDLDKIAELSTN